MSHETPVTQSTLNDTLTKICTGLLLVLFTLGCFICAQVWQNNTSSTRIETNLTAVQSDVKDLKTSQVPRSELTTQLAPIISEQSDHETRIRKLERFDARALTPKEIENGQH